MLWLAPVLAVALAAAPAADEGLLSSPERRVRSTDKRLAALLRIGVERSPTFAQLVRDLNASDVIVYIERSPDLPRTLGGRLLLLPLANQQRYLRIQVRTDLHQMELVALIGHELRHALEIAEHPTVRDDRAMRTLYQRIGHPSAAGQAHAFDTDAARITGRQVRMELAG